MCIYTHVAVPEGDLFSDESVSGSTSGVGVGLGEEVVEVTAGGGWGEGDGEGDGEGEGGELQAGSSAISAAVEERGGGRKGKK